MLTNNETDKWIFDTQFFFVCGYCYLARCVYVLAENEKAHAFKGIWAARTHVQNWSSRSGYFYTLLGQLENNEIFFRGSTHGYFGPF